MQATFRTCKRKRNPSVDPESNEYRPTKRRSIRRPTQRSVNGLEALDEISSEPFIDLKLAKRWPKDNMVSGLIYILDKICYSLLNLYLSFSMLENQFYSCGKELLRSGSRQSPPFRRLLPHHRRHHLSNKLVLFV